MEEAVDEVRERSILLSLFKSDVECESREELLTEKEEFLKWKSGEPEVEEHMVELKREVLWSIGLFCACAIIFWFE